MMLLWSQVWVASVLSLKRHIQTPSVTRCAASLFILVGLPHHGYLGPHHLITEQNFLYNWIVRSFLGAANIKFEWYMKPFVQIIIP